MLSLLTITILTCGSERWRIKTLEDGFPADGDARITTVAKLSALKPPTWTDKLPRQPDEAQVVQLEGSIVGYKLEEDEDFHVVVADKAGRTLIVEFPSPYCTRDWRLIQARSDFLKLIRRKPGRRFQTLSFPIHVLLRGVPFFDKLHGQKGLAPNGIELHPVLKIDLLKKGSANIRTLLRGPLPPPPSVGSPVFQTFRLDEGVGKPKSKPALPLFSCAVRLDRFCGLSTESM